MPREGAGDAVAVAAAVALAGAVAAVERAYQEGVEAAAPQGVAVLVGVGLRRAGASRHRLQAVQKPPVEANRQGLVSASPDKQHRV